MATLKEIAARCGCSVAAVSKALNGMPDISEATARRVRQAAEELGYVPNSAARTLRTNHSNVIGLLLFIRDKQVWYHEYFASIAAGIQEAIELKGYDLAPVTSTACGDQEHFLSYCQYRGYDGVIVMCDASDKPVVEDLLNSELPLVTIDRAFPTRSAVLSDNVRGMQDLVDHMRSRMIQAGIPEQDINAAGFGVKLQVLGVKLLPHKLEIKTWMNQQKKPLNNQGLTR